MVATCEISATKPNVVPTANTAVISGSDAARNEPNMNSRITSAASTPMPSPPPPASLSATSRTASPVSSIRMPSPSWSWAVSMIAFLSSVGTNPVWSSSTHRDDPEGAVVGDRARLRVRWLYGGHVVEPGQVGDQRVDLVGHRVHAVLGLDDDRHRVALLLGRVLGVRVDQLLGLGARQAEVVAVVVAGHGRADRDRDQGHQPEHDRGPVVALRPRRPGGSSGCRARGDAGRRRRHDAVPRYG